MEESLPPVDSVSSLKDYFRTEKSFTESLIEALLQRANEIFNTNAGIVLGRDLRLAESLYTAARALSESIVATTTGRGDATESIFVELPEEEDDSEKVAASESRNDTEQPIPETTQHSDQVLAELPSDLTEPGADEEKETNVTTSVMFTRLRNFVSSRMPSKIREKCDGYSRISKSKNRPPAPVNYGTFTNRIDSSTEASTDLSADETRNIQPRIQLKPPYFGGTDYEYRGRKSEGFGRKIYNRMKRPFSKKKSNLSYVNPAFIPSDPMATLNYYDDTTRIPGSGLRSSEKKNESRFDVIAARAAMKTRMESGHDTKSKNLLRRFDEDFTKTRRAMDKWSKLNVV